MILLKSWTQYVSKFGKLSSGHRIVKGKFSFQSQRKECQRMFKLCTIVFILHDSKVMLKILQARLQQYANQELPDVQSGFQRGRRTRDQITNIRWIMEKAREFQKNICFIDYSKAFVCVWQQTGKFLEMGVPDQLICLLRNLYEGQEATVRTGHGTTDWLKTGKGVQQAV